MRGSVLGRSPRGRSAGSPEYTRTLFLNAAALMLTVIALAQVQQYLAQGNAPTLNGGFLPLALAIYVASLLLSFLSLQMSGANLTSSGGSGMAFLCLLWSLGNLAFAVYCIFRAFTVLFAQFA